MRKHSPGSARSLILWLLILLTGAAFSYVLLLCLTSIWFGIQHLDQDGFWAPILAGLLLLPASLRVFLSIVNRLLEQRRPRNLTDPFIRR